MANPVSEEFGGRNITFSRNRIPYAIRAALNAVTAAAVSAFAFRLHVTVCLEAIKNSMVLKTIQWHGFDHASQWFERSVLHHLYRVDRMPKFSGVIPPVVSPILAPDQLDVEAVDRIVDHLIEGGVSGLFVLGTTGEGPSLTYQMRYEMVERTCERAAGRVPVLVGVTDTSIGESIALAEHAARSGAAAIVAAPPFYFDVPQSSLQDWFSRVADRSAIPLMLYNMPSCVGVDIDLDVVDALSRHPNILGIKDSGGDLVYFRRLCEAYKGREDFVVFMGPEERLAEAVALGGAGGVCGGANLFPQVYSRLYKAAVRGDQNQISYWNRTIEQIFRSIYHNEDGVMRLIPGLKHGMALRGLCTANVAPPLPPVSARHAEKIASNLDRLIGMSLQDVLPVA